MFTHRIMTLKSNDFCSPVLHPVHILLDSEMLRQSNFILARNALTSVDQQERFYLSHAESRMKIETPNLLSPLNIS
jgi:hypothetical protein